MSGSGLVQFVVNLVAILAAGGIFFAAIDKVAVDAFFAKIAKIAVGALLVIALVLTVAAVFGLAGGGVTVSPLGVVWFAVAVIAAVVVLYILDYAIDWLAKNMGFGELANPIKYILGAVVLIGLLLVAANVMFGVGPRLHVESQQPFRLASTLLGA